MINIDSNNQIYLTVTRANGVMNSFLINNNYDTSNSSTTTIMTIDLAISGTYPNSNFYFFLRLILIKKALFKIAKARFY